MDGKRLANFLLLRPALSSRNLTSLALVALFFGVYVAAGGKVSSVPKLQTGASFGGISIPDGLPKEEPLALDPVKSPPAASPKKPSKSLTADLFEDSSAKKSNVKSKQLDTLPTVAEPESEEGTPNDDLGAIEQRIKRLKAGEAE